MFPSGDMRSGVMGPVGNNYGYYPNLMSCCSHGFGYNNCYCPPGPATPYPHMYPPQPYVAMPPYHPHHHHHQPIPIPSTNPNSYPPPDAYVPLQHNAWPPVIMPQSNCCCACPNHHSYYQANHINSSHDDKLIKLEKEESQLPNVTGAEIVRPVMRNKSSQPQILWIPPQYLNSLQQQQQQQDANKGSQDVNATGQLIPFDLRKLPSFHGKDENKPVAVGARDNFPFRFPFIMMPQNSSRSEGSAANNNHIKEIEEKSSCINDLNPLKLLGIDDEDDTSVPREHVKGEDPPTDTISKNLQPQNEKVKVKDIPVKQAGEYCDMKPSANAVTKTRSQSVSPTKTSKLPPVCLRVDPLPRKKTGNGTTTSPSSKQALTSFKSKENTRQKSPQNESMFKDYDTESKQGRDLKVLHSSCQESSMDKPVVSVGEDGKGEEGREIASEVVTSESAMHSVQSETPVRLEEESPEPEVKRNLSEEAAAVRIQSAYRGYEERKWQSLQKLRQIAKVREQISVIKDRIQALESDKDMHKDEVERQRLIIGEAIMSLLLTLDTIQGLHSSIRDIRKSVAKELVSLQESLDSFHKQRSRESEHSMYYDEGDAMVVKEVLNRNETEEGDMNVKVDATNQDVNRDDRSGKENINAQDEKADEDENLENTVDSTCAELCQKTPVEPANVKQSQAETQLVANAFTDGILTPAHGCHEHLKAVAQGAPPVNGPDGCQEVENVLIVGEEGDSKVETAGVKVKGCGGENAQVIITFGEPPLEMSINRSGSGDVSENETTDDNQDGVDVDSQRVEAKAIVLESQEINYTSSKTTTENGVLSGEVSEKESEEEVDDGTLDNYMENSIEHHDLGSTKEISCEQEETNAINNSCKCMSAEILPEMDDGGACGKVENQTYEPISNSEMVELGSTHGVMVEKTEGCALLNSASEIESEESVVTDNSCGFGTQKPDKTSSESLEKPDGAGDLKLAEENEKLRETVRKLLESEKDQLTVISTLNARLKKLEKRLMKKGKRTVKLQMSPRAIGDGMNKFANKNNDEDIVVC